MNPKDVPRRDTMLELNIGGEPLTPEQIEMLESLDAEQLRANHVAVAGICICKPCQDKLEDVDEP